MDIIISESQYKVIEEFETRPQVFYSFARMPNKNWVTDDNKIYSEEFFDDKDFDEYQFDNFFDMDQMFGHKNSLFGTRGLEVGNPKRTSRSFDMYNSRVGPALVRVLKKETSKPTLNEADPKKGTGKKPKGSSRRLYTDENPKDTVSIKFKTVQDIKDTLSKESFKSKPHARQSQIINLIHQRVRAAYSKAKNPEVKTRLKRGLIYITAKKEASKRKTQRLKND